MSVYCHSCKSKTKTVAPVMLKTFEKGSIAVYGVCEICLDTKYKFLNIRQISQLNSVINVPPGATYLGYVKNNTAERVPIFPFISSIIN